MSSVSDKISDKNTLQSVKKLCEKIAANKVTQNIQNIGIASDSREVRAGDIFFAIRGSACNGEDFIVAALKNGAKHVVVRDDCDLDHIIAMVRGSDFEIGRDFILYASADTRKDFALISSVIFSKQPKRIAAVTGTNGKTSVTYFYAQIIALLRASCGVIGTNGARYFAAEKDCDDNGGVFIADRDEIREHEVLSSEKTLTTQPANKMHQILQKMRELNVNDVALEASSHGIEQSRIACVDITVAAYTNIRNEHLDYHGTFDNYFAVKKSLIEMKSVRNVVINGDMPEASVLKDFAVANAKDPFLYGKGEECDVDLKVLSCKDQVSMRYKGEDYHSAKTSAFNNFQIENLACAIGMVMCADQSIAIEEVMRVIDKIHMPPGRMELVRDNIFVDFAHTPDAFEIVLSDLRAKKCESAKLYIVFGCGGDRYAQKRREMGEIASNLADFVIVTDDNPRFEDASSIRKEIMRGVNGNGIEIADRKEAIYSALAMLKDDDMLIIAGRGNEKYMQIRGESILFSDKEYVYECLTALAMKSGSKV